MMNRLFRAKPINLGDSPTNQRTSQSLEQYDLRSIPSDPTVTSNNIGGICDISDFRVGQTKSPQDVRGVEHAGRSELLKFKVRSLSTYSDWKILTSNR
jgi:hypothetical protein